MKVNEIYTMRTIKHVSGYSRLGKNASTALFVWHDERHTGWFNQFFFLRASWKQQHYYEPQVAET